jgi:heptosyltransferase-2
MQRILLIQTAFIGDMILATGLLRILRQQFPASHIDAVAIPTGKDIWYNNPHLNNLLVFDKRGRDNGLRGLLRFARQLRGNAYDWIIAPHRSLRTGLLARLSGAAKRTSFRRSTLAWLFYNERISYRSVHELERNRDLVTAYRGPVLLPELFPDARDKASVDEIWQVSQPQRHSVVLAPASVWLTKRWPASSYARLAKDLADRDTNVYIIGAEQDKQLGEQIRELLPAAVNTCGQLNIRAAYELIQRSDVLVTNDSAPLHLGTAAGTPTIAIFGSTIPSFGFAPYGHESHQVLEVQMNCRPCTDHGRQKCPLGTLACLHEIEPARVLAEVNRRLSGKTP